MMKRFCIWILLLALILPGTALAYSDSAVAMIANYLKGTVWKYFMSLEDIQKALVKLEMKERDK